jgi:hypothetical protein
MNIESEIFIRRIWVPFLAEERDFSLIYNIQNGLRAHPASYSTRTKEFSTEDKAVGS